ncbi:MAG: DUF998 domain-containing protein [Candidatus Bathyarchaeia archaeon]
MFGFCGILTPLVAFTCTLLAVALSPHFSWADNALSDLGVIAGSPSILFNSGLMVSGALALLFALGLLVFFKKSLPGRVGALLFSFDSVALIAIGVFSENARPMHLYASVAFFVLAPVSMLFLTASFLLASKVAKGLLTLGAAMFAAAVWIAEFLWRYVPGVAIPEALSALSASLWVVIIGFDMVRGISGSSD